MKTFNKKNLIIQQDPIQRAIQVIKNNKNEREFVIVDFGCGQCKIAQHFKNDESVKVISIDHYVEPEIRRQGKFQIIQTDMRKTGLESRSVDMAIFSCCLSWGNYGGSAEEYLEEAKRILKNGSYIYVLEAKSLSVWHDNNLEELLKKKFSSQNGRPPFMIDHDDKMWYQFEIQYKY